MPVDESIYAFSGALTLKQVQTRSAAACMSSLKISPHPHEMLAVGDTKGVLTIHWMNKNLEIFRKKMVRRGRQSVAIRALAWNPQQPNKLYVGFANGDLIGYKLRIDVHDTGHEDPSSFLTFGRAIHDVALPPSGTDIFLLFGTSLAVVRQGTRAHSTIPMPPESRPIRLILDVTCVVVIFMVSEPGVLPAAIAYDLHSYEIRWKLFAFCNDMILAGAISPQHMKITILHATKGVETYTLPNLGHISTVFAARKFSATVDITYVDRGTFVCGSLTGGLLFANGTSGKTFEMKATARATYMLARLVSYIFSLYMQNMT
ncbi:hypothetical protein PC9H_001697 [Pleurotus ostreatus]|uniref:Uncharacterized protein n=1 Tax=Pleurotus ostreatus TaxID=5322 RepID=A0A8H7A498_PLEOS|nr:uncharacterized protein PC9H_001697 [Pleurotus ostreatus]KAF7441348.1 hypothetical protein PC9H_001697 [Pleurotus ostreatus]KAJ8699103.1 hypothetical protein PTI98_002256 [Pleurotus ostreatus]